MRPRERSESVEITSYSSGGSSSNLRRDARKAARPLNRKVIVIEDSEEETDDEADPNDMVVPQSLNTKGGTSLLAFKEEVMTELKPTKFEDNSKTSILTEQTRLDDKKPKLETKFEAKLEPARIGITIKSEREEDDKKAFITLIKREKKPDLFNLDALGLGHPLVVHDKRGWTRKEIGDAFGGSHQECKIHWDNAEILATKHKPEDLPYRQPFAAFNFKWNPHLPVNPGEHGTVFTSAGLHTFHDGAPVNQAIPLFVCFGPNDWRLMGLYETAQWGEIATEDLAQMPERMIITWAAGLVGSVWGRQWIEGTNSGLPAGQKIVCSEEGVRVALFDGRLKLIFTIMKCVEYRAEMLNRLEHFRAHPLPSKSSNKKKEPKKRAWEEVEQGD